MMTFYLFSLMLLFSGRVDTILDDPALLFSSPPPMDWSKLVSAQPQDKLQAVESMGICINEYKRLPEYFWFIDFTGDGTNDIIYQGENADCIKGIFEGWVTRLYQVTNGKAQMILDQSGEVIKYIPPTSSSAAKFVIRDPGCCADERTFFGFFVPQFDGTHLHYNLKDKVMTFWELKVPTHFLLKPKRFRSKIRHIWLRSRCADSTVAVYPKRASGIALAKSDDSLWWFVLMDSAKPESAVYDDGWAWTDQDIFSRRAGWLRDEDILLK